MTTLVSPYRVYEDASAEDSDRYSIIAREGSDLATRLRAGGWVARVGWRTVTDAGDSVWFMRFERHDAES